MYYLNDAITDIDLEVKRKLALIDLHKYVKSDCAISTIYGAIDKLTARFAWHEIESIVLICQVELGSNRINEMRLLVAYGRWLNSYRSLQCESVINRLLSLRCPLRPVISASVFALHSSYLCNIGQFQRAIEVLDEGFDWLLRFHIDSPSSLRDLVFAAVFFANRVGRHDLALQYAYKSHELSYAEENSFGIEMANFMVLNSSRLNFKGKVNISYDYEKAVKILEKDQSKIALVNQRLLPVYAALAELDIDQPDLCKVEYFLGFAKDLGIFRGNGLGARAWLLANAKLLRLKSRPRAARDAVVHSQRHCDLFDFKLNAEYQKQCEDLDLLPDKSFDIQTIKKSAWRSMEKRAVGFC